MAIPDRWTAYKACGMVIEGTKFICFKVPLRRSVQINNRQITEIWDIPEVLARIPKLGAVIDLTNTNRYYNPQDFENAGVKHKKILIPGRVIPPKSTVKQFMDTVDEFLAEIGDSLIGIHCTHGLNRTGYLVCRYMMDRMGMPGKEAIKKFEKARGYQIERENYIADILGKAPPPPEFGSDTKVVPLNGTDRKRSDRPRKEKNVESWRDRPSNPSHENFRIQQSTSQDIRKHRQNSNSSGSSFEYDYKHHY